MTQTEHESLAAMNGMLEQLIPRAHQMGVHFTELRPGHVRADVPFEGNGNHFGVMYAGVTFTVAEVLGGAMHLATFDVTTHYPVVRAMSIDFSAPGRGPLHAVAELGAGEIARIRAASTGDGGPVKVAFVLEAQVFGEDGTLVAATRADYQLRPHGS
jgi:acyl-coenzyme A thioesterase PaaI-like protein